MKTTVIRCCLALLLLLAIGSSVSAQTSITTTTLTNAITTRATRQSIVVGATTGMTAGSTFLYIDGSIYQINSVDSSTGVTVTNTYYPATHLASVTIYVVPLGAQIGRNPVGSCIRSTAGGPPQYSPYTLMFNTQTGDVAACRGGTLGSRSWVLTNPYSVGGASNNPPQSP